MHHVNGKHSVVARLLQGPFKPLSTLAVALALGLAGCGQKGPLTLSPAASSASAPSPSR